MQAKPIPYAKIAGIAGVVLGEIYMVFTVGSPRLKDVDIPTTSVLLRMLAASPFFAGFGLAVGTGIGLLLDGLLNKKSPKLPSNDTPDK
ncbi:MAG: hypothetical protein WCO60_06630 [Verrucomicrobiota bacterium]